MMFLEKQFWPKTYEIVRVVAATSYKQKRIGKKIYIFSSPFNLRWKDLEWVFYFGFTL